jgi:hypothetical protein
MDFNKSPMSHQEYPSSVPSRYVQAADRDRDMTKLKALFTNMRTY